MNKKLVVSALSLFLLGLETYAADSPVAPDNAPPADTSPATYIGAGTRFGIGYDSKTKLRGEVYQIFNESPSSAWIGEGWVTDRAGGLQLNYHWLPESTLKDPGAFVRKAFAAIDQNQQHDRKITLGGGAEYERWFGNAYVSRGITGRRSVSDLTTSVTETVSGSDNGRPFLQDVTTATRVQVFERAYDYGVGLRGGHFYEPAQLRLTAGADYEWGRDSAHQTSVSLNAEKFFSGTPHSLVFYAEALRKSGEFEVERNDHRVGVIYRYELGGRSYRPIRETRAVPVEVPAVTPPASTAAAAAPRVEKRMVKTTATLKADAFFNFDRSNIRPDAKAALDELVTKLKASGFEGNIHVVGHTDNIGTAAYNQKLSERRAASVKHFIVASGVVPADRIVTEGRGLRDPRYPNTREGRPKNRRVDIEFITFENKEETVRLPSEPVAAPTPPTQPVIEWRREVIDTEPAWLRRALHNTAQHKQTVDVYRQQETRVTVTQGERRFINRAPIAQNDSFSVNENSNNNALDVLANDSDPDGDPLTIASVTAPAHGTAVIANGKVSYTPSANFVGNDTFSYTVSDGKGGTASATVAVAVAAVNRAPVAQNDVFTVAQDAPATVFDVLANDSDPDGDALTITAVTTPAHGAASISGNKVSYKPAAGFSGQDSFGYTISDGKGGTASATVTVTVTPAAVVVPTNHPPVANDDFLFVFFNTPAFADVLANDFDPDGDPLTIVSFTQPAHGTVQAGNLKNLVYIPTQNFVGADVFTYTISDGRGGTATATVKVFVDP